MAQLVMLLESSAMPNWLQLAELYRELGDFNAAARAMSYLTDKKTGALVVVDKLISL